MRIKKLKRKLKRVILKIVQNPKRNRIVHQKQNQTAHQKQSRIARQRKAHAPGQKRIKSNKGQILFKNLVIVDGVFLFRHF